MQNDLIDEINLKTEEKQITVGGIKIFYVESGEGFPTILLHGWPTSSYLWRNIYPVLAKKGKIIVPDLPGYGKSDKPCNVGYSVSEQAERLDVFIRNLNYDKINLVVHDIGGTIGLLWTVRNIDKINKLVITDTIIFPELKGILLSMRLLILFAKLPFLKNILASNYIIEEIMRLGVYRKSKLTSSVLNNYLEPFRSSEAKKIYLKSLSDFKREECREIIDKSPALNIPVKIICGEKDFMMREEMFRIKRLLPDAEFELMKNASHFLQEDQPEKLSVSLGDFLYE